MTSERALRDTNRGFGKRSSAKSRKDFMAIGAKSASALDHERVLYRGSPEIHRENQQRV